MAKSLNKKDLETFRKLLEVKRDSVYQNAKKTLSDSMVLDPNDLPDEMDLAASEALQSFEFRLRGREKAHLKKLDLALRKIGDGSFGVCVECEEPINKKRLEAKVADAKAGLARTTARQALGDYFNFATPEDLPDNLTWQNGLDQPYR